MRYGTKILKIIILDDYVRRNFIITHFDTYLFAFDKNSCGVARRRWWLDTRCVSLSCTNSCKSLTNLELNSLEKVLTSFVLWQSSLIALSRWLNFSQSLIFDILSLHVVDIKHAKISPILHAISLTRSITVNVIFLKTIFSPAIPYSLVFYLILAKSISKKCACIIKSALESRFWKK